MANLNHTWADLMDRIAHNVGVDNPDSKQKNVLKNYLYDSIITIHATAEDRKTRTVVQVNDGTAPDASSLVATLDVEGDGTSGTRKYAMIYRSALGDTEKSDIISNTFRDNDTIIITGMPELANGSTLVLLRTKTGSDDWYEVEEFSAQDTEYEDDYHDDQLTTLYTEPTIYSSKSPMSLPDDYYSLKELIFKDTDGKTLGRAELTEEEFLRWTPQLSTTGNVQTFNFEGEGLNSTLLTEENYRHDGKIGFTIKDDFPVTINFKPRFNGSIEYIVTLTPVPTIDANLANQHDLMKGFEKLIVLDATINYLTAKLTTLTNESQVTATQLALRIHIDNYKTLLKRYTGKVQETANPLVIKGFSLISDASMEI